MRPLESSIRTLQRIFREDGREPSGPSRRPGVPASPRRIGRPAPNRLRAESAGPRRIGRPRPTGRPAPNRLRAAYTVNVALNVDSNEASRHPPDERQALVADLLDELTRWPPRDRAGAFKMWHRDALSLVHLNVVNVLEVQGPLPMGHLAEELDVSVASATGIVTRMEARGLVQRRHDSDDRRIVLVQLTEAGSNVFAAFEGRRREHLARLLQELTTAELAGFLAGLRALHVARERIYGAGGTGAAAGGPGPGSPPRSPGRAPPGGS